MEEESRLEPLFSRKALSALIIPLIAEQFLMMLVGMVDTFMVTSAGEAAIAGVTLVDSINTLLIQIFTALSTGGAVVISQYLGRRDLEQARIASKQMLQLLAIFPTILSVAALLLRRWLLPLLFGSVEPSAMASALDYFTATALAYPFISLYNGGAALFRCMGRSSIPMFNSALVNLINVAVNAVLIFGFHMGALGAGIGTLVSRMVAAILILVLLQHRDCPLHMPNPFRPIFRRDMVRRILSIGIPNGLEGSLFQGGKLLVMRLITTFGTAAMAANGIANSLSALVLVPGQAVGAAMITVVGQCIGAGTPEQAASYTKKLMKLAYLCLGSVSLAFFFLSGPILSLVSLTPAALEMATTVLRWFCLFTILVWPLSFTLPNALRAAGDVVFPMVISLFSMFVFRIGFSYLLGPDSLFGFQLPGLHLLGVWLAMIIDWIVRGITFSIRFHRGKWKEIRVI